MNFYKPIFKKLLKLKEPLLLSFKIFKFKRKKWKNFVINCKRRNLRTKFNKFKIIDQNKQLINKNDNYKNEYKQLFLSIKTFSFFYSNFLKKRMALIKKVANRNTLNFLEQRLDCVLLRSKFGLTIRSIQKLILTGCVFVNYKNVYNKSFILKSGDFIYFNLCFNIYKKYLVCSLKWPVPLSNIVINYITQEFFYLTYLKQSNFVLLFPCYLKINQLFYCFYSLKVKQLIVNQFFISSSLIKN